MMTDPLGEILRAYLIILQLTKPRQLIGLRLVH
jgi:hypothetical protein